MTENKENINPAILHEDTLPTDMSAEEFRRTLYTWFEDRGLLSELRAHLRRQMIGILKDTSLGQSVSKVQNLSPKTQVINLLIAEFLLKYKYHYSLSVFSTEVPFVNILPEFSSSLLNSPATSNDKNFNDRKFTEQNFWDILQTIGLSRNSKEGQVLYDYYFKNENEPLIICLLRFFTNLSNFKKIFIDDNTYEPIDSNELEPRMKDIHNLLVSYEIEGSVLGGLLQSLKIIFEREESRIKTEETERSNKLQEEIQRNIQNREAEIHKMIHDMEKSFGEEKERVMKELNNEKNCIEKLKSDIIKQKNELDKKNDTLEKRESLLREREQDMDTQTDILRTRIKVMQNVYDSIIEENKKINDIRIELQRNQIDLQPNHSEELFQRLQSEYEFLRNEINETKNTIQKLTVSEDNLTQMKDMVDNPELKLLKSMLERIQVENSELRCVNSEQQQKLEELNIRNSILMSELESSQTTINLLMRNHQTLTVPPLAAPSSARRNRTSNNLSGAGENHGYNGRPISQPSYRYSIPQFARNKTPRRIIVHNSTDESSSPTEEILNEARQRLRRLEEETEVVDRNYRAFRQRHSQNGITRMLHSRVEDFDNQMPSTSRFDPLYTNANFSNFTPTRTITLTIPTTSFTATNANSSGRMNEATENNNSASPNNSSAGVHIQNLSISDVEISSDKSDSHDTHDHESSK